jgi:hypothetical protein
MKYLFICLQSENSLERIHLGDVYLLGFMCCDYNINNLSKTLENMDIRLIKLDTFWVVNVNVTQIIICCPVLKILFVRFCRTILTEFLSSLRNWHILRASGKYHF